MTGIVFDDAVKFTLTDDYMNTIIEDKVAMNSSVLGNRILLNNLAMVSIAQRAEEFCGEYAKTQPDGMLPTEAPIFNLKAKFYTDGTIILYQDSNMIRCNYVMFIRYYNDILCKIMADKKMETAGDFEKKNLSMVNDIKKNNPHPREKSS